MQHLVSRLIVVAVVFTFASGVEGQRTATISRKAVSVNQNPAVVTQTNCVNAPAMPDIVLVKLYVTMPPKPAAGATYPVTAILENRGQCETGAFKFQMSVLIETSGQPDVDKVILTRMIPSMQPTRDREPAYVTVSVDYTLLNRDAVYKFYASADPENHVHEFIENNNAVERNAGDAGNIVNINY